MRGLQMTLSPIALAWEASKLVCSKESALLVLRRQIAIPDKVRHLALRVSSVELIEESRCIDIDGELRLQLTHPYFTIVFVLAKEMKRRSRLDGLPLRTLLRHVREYTGPAGEKSRLKKESALEQEWRDVIQGRRRDYRKKHYAKYRFVWLGKTQAEFTPLEDDKSRFLKKLFPRYRIAVPNLAGLSVLERRGAKDSGGTFGEFLSGLKRQGAPVDFIQYERFDEIFTYPKEYERILDTVERRGIVFIVGPPHVGKTFTAARLLWHYYRVGGREPRWLLAKDWGEEAKAFRLRTEPGASLAGWIVENVGSKLATYIEDPFGRISESDTKWRRLEPARLLLYLVDHIQKSVPNARVVVTSREKLFDKLAPRRSALGDLVARLRASVRLAIGSYSTKNKRELLMRYAHLHACRWSDSVPQGLVREAREQLATPHAISLFCKWSKKSRTLRQCLSHINRASAELTTAFSNEIAGLNDAPIAVLLVSGHCDWADVKLPDAFSAGFPRLAGSHPHVVWQQALDALADRLAHDEKRGTRLEHPSYLKALNVALENTPKIRRLYREMISGLGRAADVKMRQLSVCLVLDSLDPLSIVPLDTTGRSLLREFASDVGIVRLELAGGLARNCVQLGRTERTLLRRLAHDLEEAVGEHCHPVASGLACNIVHLDRWGRAKLEDYSKSGSVLVRLAVADGLASGYKWLDRRHRKALLDMLRKETQWHIILHVGTILATQYDELDEQGREICDMACGSEHDFEDGLTFHSDGERDFVQDRFRKLGFGTGFDISRCSYGDLHLRDPIHRSSAFELHMALTEPFVSGWWEAPQTAKIWLASMIAEAVATRRGNHSTRTKRR